MMDCLYLLDSNIVSEFSKLDPDENVMAQMKRKERFCAISAVTLQELQMGLELLPEGKRKDQIRGFLEVVKRRFSIIPYDRSASVVCGEILAAMQKVGQPRPVCDSQIAATALANSMILVTRNTKDFQPLQKISLLKLENWFEV